MIHASENREVVFGVSPKLARRPEKLTPERSEHVLDAGELVTRTPLGTPIFHFYCIETEPVGEGEIVGLALTHQLFRLAYFRF